MSQVILVEMEVDVTNELPSPSVRVTIGFVAAGLFNILGMLVVTRGFTSDALTRLDPGAFSTTGCLVVCLWGLAYLSLARTYQRAPLVSLVFAVEKAFYSARWAWWWSESANQTAVLSLDTWSPFFYMYGLFDGAFALFFFGVWWRYRSGSAVLT